MPFREIAENVTERVDDPAASGLDHYVGLEHLDPDTLRISRWGSPSDVEATKLRFYPGDVIYARRRAYQRKLGVAEWDGIASAHALVLRARPQVCLPEFLPYLLQSDQFHQRALGISVGSLSPTINWTTLASQEFALPDIGHQAAVVDVLGVTASVLQRYEELQAALARQREALAAELWRASATWIELQSLAAITVGIVVKPADLYVEHDGIPALRSLNVLPGRLREEELVHISESGNAMHRKSQLFGGDVVVVRTGRPGDAAVIPHDGAARNAIDLLIVRCGPSLRSEYLVALLNSSSGRKQMLGRSAGTAQQHLNASQLSKVQIPAVPLGDQDRFVDMSNGLDALAAKAASAASQVASLRRTLREALLRQDHGHV